MQYYIARRLLLFIPTIVILSLLVFLFLRVIPGDPAQLVLGGGVGGAGSVSEEDLENVRKAWGTDKPIHIQYGVWVRDLLQGDFGISYARNTSIREELKHRIPLTLELAAMAIAISFVLALPLGIVSAIAQDSPFDYLSKIASFIGVAIPNFVVGLAARPRLYGAGVPERIDLAGGATQELAQDFGGVLTQGRRRVEGLGGAVLNGVADGLVGPGRGVVDLDHHVP